MLTPKQTLPGLLLSLMLSGCGSLTGLDASDSFSCPKDAGLPCLSMQEAYQASNDRTLPHQRRGAKDEADRAPAPDAVAEVKTETNASTNLLASDAEAERRAEEANLKSKLLARAERESQRGFVEGGRTASVASSATPARLPERLIRIWVAPWTDEEGDLHDAHYIFAKAADARWATAKRRRPEGEPFVTLPFGRTPEKDEGSRAPEARTGAERLIDAKRRALEGAPR